MNDLKKSSNKTKAAIVLLIVMVIILISNFIRLQNSQKANENINALYNDRLVVAHYIFQYDNELYSIKAKALQSEFNDLQKKAAIASAIQRIHKIDKLYLNTFLTPKEKTSFVSFLASCSAIEIESQNNNWVQVIESGDQALKTLKLLSQIQINEAKTKLESSNSIHRDNTTWCELQIALLVVLGSFALYLLLAKKKKIRVKIPESPSMN
ncbi:chemoreceptor-like protein with four helix bundle sensory module [Flavobacterium sp. 103]|uniref:MCP four helix bundle domain-containing protein n=1 Tax=Flavobacterium sp. 103 TaxID=2135624 RepID=UPI000D5EDCE3|nr:MCP four helix bundle domain-containing protein [Flavobacterium sp. 103]PVX44458.1 chemoreceptor-like protein with four helix bundle sensory module [Flavobacterium sp. 103]